MDGTKHGIWTKVCPRCGYEGDPIDALFYLSAASILVPMSYDSIRKFLSRHKEEFPPVYFHVGRGHKRRVLTGEDIKRIRATLVRGPVRGTLNDLFRRGMVSPFVDNDKGKTMQPDDFVTVGDLTCDYKRRQGMM
jgi:hypothetical protein